MVIRGDAGINWFFIITDPSLCGCRTVMGSESFKSAMQVRLGAWISRCQVPDVPAYWRRMDKPIFK